MTINTVEKTLFRLVDIDEIENVEQLHNMYDITVEDDCSFTLDSGVISHNSAIGNFLVVRDPKKHGGYPIRGKPLNVRGMKPVDILKNKEIAELMSIIGLEFGKPPDNLNYSRITIMTDGDLDGIGGIQCLLLNLFSNWPQLFTDGRIQRLVTPLYICTKGKAVQSFYSKEEFDKFNSKGYEVTYAKGLGTLTKEVYKQCINNPFFVKISGNAEDFEMLEMAFGESADRRKNWMLL